MARTHHDHDHDHDQAGQRWHLNPKPKAAPAEVSRADATVGESSWAMAETSVTAVNPRSTYTTSLIDNSRAGLYPLPYFDDEAILGDLRYGLPAAPQPVGDVRWAASLRRFGRATVWSLPVAVIALTLASVWGWPTPEAEPSGASPGTWLVVMLLGLGLWLIGTIAIAALAATTPGRPWATAAVLSGVVGTTLLGPVLGVVGLARPAVSRTSVGTAAADSLEAQFLDGTVGRWLAVLGLLLLGIGAVALGSAVLASDVLNRIDGWFVLAGVAVAAIAAYLSWDFLLALAGMLFLAASLGIAWTASRLVVDRPAVVAADS